MKHLDIGKQPSERVRCSLTNQGVVLWEGKAKGSDYNSASGLLANIKWPSIPQPH